MTPHNRALVQTAPDSPLQGKVNSKDRDGASEGNLSARSAAPSMAPSMGEASVANSEGGGGRAAKGNKSSDDKAYVTAGSNAFSSADCVRPAPKTQFAESLLVFTTRIDEVISPRRVGGQASTWRGDLDGIPKASRTTSSESFSLFMRNIGFNFRGLRG